MKKAVVTILGTLGVPQEGQESAIYRFSKELNKFSKKLTKERYINTLPLLIDVFQDREIVPIATKKAKNTQKETLDFLNIKSSALDNTVLINESDYEDIFQKISKLLQDNQYESFIIDLTHGFRHLPILMIVNLIIASIKDIDKIEHIFFAKEIIPRKEYEIIDLLDYIGLAKLSFVLETFNENYTVGNRLIFKNSKYQDLVDSLRIISSHILANSLKTLVEKDNNLVSQTIAKLNSLKQEDKNIATFSKSIDNIIKHLKKIEVLKDEKDYIKLFKFSYIMNERDYLLNSITLLNESVGMYCAELIRDVNDEISNKIDRFIKDEEFSLYKLARESKNLVKLENSFNGNYIDETFPKNEILSYIKSQDNIKLKGLIESIGNLRNNLAHGNSSEEIADVKEMIDKLLKEYQGIIKVPHDIDKEDKIKELQKRGTKRKKKRKKIIPKGIDVSKNELNELTNFFSNK